MPSPADLAAGLLGFIRDALSDSSLRLGAGPTLAIVGVVLVLLQLVARPISRWITTDPGGLAGIGRAMAVAAEAGTDAVMSLGTAGLARSTDAFARLQTLAAMPLLGHLARAAARSGVPVRVLVNDSMAAVVAAASIDAAHHATATRERSGRSRVVVVGEGRSVSAGLVLTATAQPAAAIAAGSLREEAVLEFDGLRGESGTSLVAATAEPGQAPSAWLGADGALIGAQLFNAPGDLRADAIERTAVIAANRLVAVVVVIIVAASILSVAGIIRPADLMLGIGRP